MWAQGSAFPSRSLQGASGHSVLRRWASWEHRAPQQPRAERRVVGLSLIAAVTCGLQAPLRSYLYQYLCWLLCRKALQ